MHSLSRRTLLRGLAPVGTLAAMPMAAFASLPADSSRQSGVAVVTPQQFGARADGVTLDTKAINLAIDTCSQQGGGIVYLAPGTYLSGSVILKSHVTLYLEGGAVLLGSQKITDYEPMIGGASGHGDTGVRHLIFARGAENVGLAGPGTVDGQGESYWKPSGIPPLPPADAWMDVIARSYTEKGERPSPMVEFVQCKRVRVEDVRIQHAPSWTMRFVECDEIQVRGISIRNPVYGHNTDGIDITGVSNMFMSDCSIDTGDDCICIKSQAPYGGQPRLTRNVVITNCVMTTCSNGFKIGTATEGGVENITLSNCIVYNDEVDYKYRVVSGIAIEAVDGGWVDGITISNVRMQRVRTPFFVRLGDRSRPFPSDRRGIRGVSIDNLHATGSILASSVTGLPGAEVRDVSLSHMTLENDFAGRPEWLKREVPENPKGYPEARMFGMLPCTGLYVRHVRDFRVRDISFRSAENEKRSTILCDDMGNAMVSGLRFTPIQGDEPLIGLQNCSDVWLTGNDFSKARQGLDAPEGRNSHITETGNLKSA